MRQKKKLESSKLEQEKNETCVKCSKFQTSSFDETETQSKQTTLSTLKSVLKRSASHKSKEKVSKIPEKVTSKEMQIVAKKGKNRVQFDETQNKYFEADYVILIHEEDYDLDDYYDEGSPFDDEDNDVYDDEDDEDSMQPKICCSNPNCNNTIILSNYPGFGYAANGFGFNHSKGGGNRDRFDFSSHFYDATFEEINQNLRKSSANATNRCENEKYRNSHNYFQFDGSLPKPEASQDLGEQVTLSPPEGYKDGGSQGCPHHGLHFHNGVNDLAQKRPAVQSLDFNDGETQSEEEEEEENEREYQKNEISMEDEESTTVKEILINKSEEPDSNLLPEEKPEKLKQRFIVETITMTTVTERRIVTESSDEATESVLPQPVEETKRSGILKGGKLWRNSTEKPSEKFVNYNEVANQPKLQSEQTGDVEGVTTPDKDTQDIGRKDGEAEGSSRELGRHGGDSVSPDSTELTLTFKLGQHLLVGNSLKPNSAMRQLFPGPRFVSPPGVEDGDGKFLVTAESLKMFEEAKKSKILGNVKSDDLSSEGVIKSENEDGDDEMLNNRISRTIERNTLRRSLIKYSYEFRNKRLLEKKKNENSLEERIRQLTCDIDEDDEKEQEKTDTDKDASVPSRTSPQGEESQEQDNALAVEGKVFRSAETASVTSSSSTASSTYKKLTDLFSRKSNPPPIIEDINRNFKSETVNVQCDLVLNSENLASLYSLNPQAHRNSFATLKNFAQRMPPNDARKQFLHTLSPLTACVNPEDKENLTERYRLIEGGDKSQPTGRNQSDYSLRDIEDGLKDFEPKKLGNQPDVIAETPQNETPNDELAMFVQQDSGRIEKLKKKYSAADDKSDDDDDYGFNKRPFVKGVKASLSAAEENPPVTQSQMPKYGCSKPATTATTATAGNTTWPYYSQDPTDPKLRNFYQMKQEDGSYVLYSSPQDYRGYAELGNANYVGVQPRMSYVLPNQANPVAAAAANAFYKCHPIRLSGYSELPNYQFRHPPHSPPPMRRLIATQQPSPMPSEDGKIKIENRIYGSRVSDNYGYATIERSKVVLPDGANFVPPQTTSDGIAKTPDSMFNRKPVPNVHNPCLQMKFAPVTYHQGAMPTASIRFSASCSPHPVVDESNVIIEPHYSTFPHPPGQNTVGVIRVEQGQQMIRVPVPYATGTPVQVHLMAGRLGRSDSPQRPNSPQTAAKVPMQAYNHYVIAKGTPNAQQVYGPQQPASQATATEMVAQPPTDPLKTVDFEKQGKAIAIELQQRQKLALSRSVSQETNHQGRAPTLAQQERGVPEGAASSSVYDSLPPNADATVPAPPAGNTVYYTMNV